MSSSATSGFMFLNAQRFLHSRPRSVSYRDDSPSRHPEVLLFRIWAWVSAKDGSMIWDESRRTVLQSHQRVLAHKRTAIFRSRIHESFGMTTGYSFYPHSHLSAFSLVTIHENDGILDEERRTWTRSVGTKNRSSRRTGTRSGTKNRLSSANGEPFSSQPGSLVLSYHEPAPQPRSLAFLTTCILELATELLQAISEF